MGSECSVCRGNVGGRRETPPWISTELFGAAAPALQGGVCTDPPRCGSRTPRCFLPTAGSACRAGGLHCAELHLHTVPRASATG